MYCKNCGKQVGDDARFCKNCGVRISDDRKQVQPSQVTIESSHMKYLPPHMRKSLQEYPHQEYPQQAYVPYQKKMHQGNLPSKRSGNKKMIGFLTGAGILVTLIAVIVTLNPFNFDSFNIAMFENWETDSDNRVKLSKALAKYDGFDSDWSEGLLRVVKKNLGLDDSQWGYIDKTGKEIIPCILFRGYRLSEGLVQFCKDEKYGFLDKTGKVVIPCIYDKVDSFSEGLAGICKNGMWGFIDKNGKEVIPCVFWSVSSFSGGFAKVSNKDGKWGFIDKNGKEVIPIISRPYSYFSGFSEGLAMVRQQEGLKISFGFIDETGKLVIPCIYSTATNFSGGLAIVSIVGKIGCIDKKGKIVVPIIYDHFDSFSEGLAFTMKIYNKNDVICAYIDKTGKEVIRNGGGGKFLDGLAIVGKNNKSGVIDKTGKEVIPFIYNDVGYGEGVFKVKKDGKFGFIDKTGKEVIPFIYESAEIFSDGFAHVRLNKQRGFVDKEGYYIGKGVVYSPSELLALNSGIIEKEKMEKEEKDEREKLKREEANRNRVQSQITKTYNYIKGETFEATVFSEQKNLSLNTVVQKLTFNPKNEREGTVLIQTVYEESSAATPGSRRTESDRAAYHIRDDGKIIIGEMIFTKEQSDYGINLYSNVPNPNNRGNTITFRKRVFR